MEIFDFIKDILYKKSGELLKKKELESEFQPYMIQRWLSMHSSTNVKILNATTNKLYNAVTEKDSWYKLFLATIPKSKFKRFRYIKKSSNRPSMPRTSTEDAIKFVAKTKNISEREVRDYVREYGLDLTTIENSLKEM